MIKVLGALDIIAALILLASIFLPVPHILIGIFGVYLLTKGLIFVGSGLDILSLMDIMVGLIIIVAVYVTMPPLIASIAAIYLIVKGSFSLFA